MLVSFTGTRRGLTYHQVDVLYGLMKRFEKGTFHHGDCVGADAEAHEIVRRIGGFDIDVHPCDIEKQRAFCEGASQVYDELPPLDRNKIIVNEGRVLIACPKGFSEEKRSGTWATIRYARQINRTIIIIWPNGSVKYENQK